MKGIFLLAALALAPIAAWTIPFDRASSGTADMTFIGTVFEAETGAPVEGAQVALEGTEHRTVTRSNGHYRLVVPRDQLSIVRARIVVRHDGFADATAEVDLRADSVHDDFPVAPIGLAQRQETDGSMVREEERLGVPLAAPQAAVPGRATLPERALTSVGRANGSIGYAADLASAAWAPPMSFPDWNREAYAHISENAFLSARDNPLSTFSIDVDRASYSNVRRFLLERQLPPVDAVRIEEMVNYFSYDYPTPEGEHPIAVATELGAAPWQPTHRLLRISLASRPIDTSRLPANNLVFLLDVSGSMSSPDKLPLVKRSLRLLVNELRPRDRVAIVVYAGAAGLVLPSTSGEERAKILAAIEMLESGGSTAGGEGLRLAYRVAAENFIEGGNNRVILATDGDFNVGPSSDSEMIRLVEEKRRQGTFLTVLGFGTGNLQDSKMEQMANHGNGNYAYIDSLLEARKVLVTEMGGTLLTVAQDVKIQVEFNPDHVGAYRLIGYENRLLADEDFNDDTIDAGEIGAGHTVTALFEIIPVGAESTAQIRGRDPLRYQPEPLVSSQPRSDEVAYVRVRYKPPTGTRSMLLEHAVRPAGGRGSADLRFAAAVAGFGMLLRDSEHRGRFSANDVIALAREGLGDDREGYREEFVRLVRTYQMIADGER